MTVDDGDLVFNFKISDFDEDLCPKEFVEEPFEFGISECQSMTDLTKWLVYADLRKYGYDNGYSEGWWPNADFPDERTFDADSGKADLQIAFYRGLYGFTSDDFGTNSYNSSLGGEYIGNNAYVAYKFAGVIPWETTSGDIGVSTRIPIEFAANYGGLEIEVDPEGYSTALTPGAGTHLTYMGASNGNSYDDDDLTNGSYEFYAYMEFHPTKPAYQDHKMISAYQTPAFFKFDITENELSLPIMRGGYEAVYSYGYSSGGIDETAVQLCEEEVGNTISVDYTFDTGDFDGYSYWSGSSWFQYWINPVVFTSLVCRAVEVDTAENGTFYGWGEW